MSSPSSVVSVRVRATTGSRAPLAWVSLPASLPLRLAQGVSLTVCRLPSLSRCVPPVVPLSLCFSPCVPPFACLLCRVSLAASLSLCALRRAFFNASPRLQPCLPRRVSPSKPLALRVSFPDSLAVRLPRSVSPFGPRPPRVSRRGSLPACLPTRVSLTVPPSQCVSLHASPLRRELTASLSQ
jgi:hypothetical protein